MFIYFERDSACEQPWWGGAERENPKQAPHGAASPNSGIMHDLSRSELVAQLLRHSGGPQAGKTSQC